MSVVTSIEDAGASRKTVSVAVPAAAVDAETRRVIDEYRRNARLPGFRKGKAPQRVVEQRFRDEIRTEVIERLLPRFWKQAEGEAGIQALLEPQVEDLNYEPGQDLTFRAVVDVRPEVELGELEFELPDPSVEATDEEVDETLQDLRRRFGDWNPVERTAGQGDRVSVQVKPLNTAEGEEAEAEEQPVEFEIGGGQVWEELSVAVTGLAAEQEAEFSRRVEPQEEGKEAYDQRFRVRLVAVKELELAELDDDLASTVGDYDTLDALRQEIVQGLGQKKEQERREARERALLDQLRERYPMEIPERVLEKEIQRLLTERAEHLVQRGVDIESPDIDWPKIGEQLRPLAEKQVHARLLLDAVAEHEQVFITPQELEVALSAIARHQNRSTAALRQELDGSGRLEVLRSDMLRDKTIRQMLGESYKPMGVEMASDDETDGTDAADATEE
jgi:trigger factor